MMRALILRERRRSAVSPTGWWSSTQTLGEQETFLLDEGGGHGADDLAEDLKPPSQHHLAPDPEERNALLEELQHLSLVEQLHRDGHTTFSLTTSANAVADSTCKLSSQVTSSDCE